ncbi:MAG: GNAT family N-acetyltransferase [Candidatus Brachytrichaceae bacterium NZ_4S206]|jgi:ribosomal protein S18 acetylase RimI-like enzyme
MFAVRPVIQAAREADLPRIAALAGEIWRQYYPGIISREQIEYMLGWMYAPERLRQELREEGVRFRLLRVGQMAVGFAAFGPIGQPGEFKLHKLYLAPAFHGRGWGGRLLRHCLTGARRAGGRRMILAVNKRNYRAVQFYQQHGFVIVKAVVSDIGGGFVMDDFILARSLGK